MFRSNFALPKGEANIAGGCCVTLGACLSGFVVGDPNFGASVEELGAKLAKGFARTGGGAGEPKATGGGADNEESELELEANGPKTSDKLVGAVNVVGSEAKSTKLELVLWTAAKREKQSERRLRDQ